MTDENITGTHCCDCGGWPIDGGAYFLGVLFIKEGEPIRAVICELCWLKRLGRRGGLANIASGPSFQVTVPELGLWRDGDQSRMEKLSRDLIDCMLALQIATGKGWMNETMHRRGEAYLKQFVGGIPEKYREGLTVEKVVPSCPSEHAPMNDSGT